jgi:hypothetical protein
MEPQMNADARQQNRNVLRQRHEEERFGRISSLCGSVASCETHCLYCLSRGAR